MQIIPNIYDQGQTLLFDKPYGWTSFDLVKRVRRAIKAGKVGHAGTLDPLATGLLIICSGKHTKKIPEIQILEKEYKGKMVIGAVTPSFDRETPVVDRKPFDFVTKELIEMIIKNFRGEIAQIPPIHSAKKIEGERAYKIARRGEKAEMKPVTLKIHEFEITDINLPEIDFKVICSKGTYIRSLIHDFGQALGCGAYLHTLCRTRIGDYKLEDAYSIFRFIDKLRPDNQEVDSNN